MASDTAPLRVGICGLGTVGGGTLTILRRNAESIAARVGRRIVVTAAAVRDVRKAEQAFGMHTSPTEADPEPFRIVADPLAVATDADVDVVVEAIGGCDREGPAFQTVMAAIKARKHVVTANKALLAVHGEEM
jgi:homoserine dehydrogenase